MFESPDFTQITLKPVYYDDNTSEFRDSEWSLVLSIFPVRGKKTDC